MGGFPPQGAGGGEGGATEATLLDVKDELQILNSLVPAKYDEIVNTYIGNNLTEVVYKYNNITVVTLTLTYDVDDNLTRIQIT